MKILKFKHRFVPAILSGEKTSTWRLFDDKDLKEGDELLLIDKETDENFAEAEIVSVKEKKISDIEGADYEGHEMYMNKEKMYKALQGYYGKEVGPDTLVKIIIFRLTSKRP
ncbi:MAG: ASCH domain-containing protein [Candidatus Sungbacteria bacterium]|nr:ASCH domain-containing protein [Candidatus Sungbacteria bacterium]